MSRKPLFVRAEWDEEAHVWVATSDDVPGLTTEEDTLEALVEKLKIMILITKYTIHHMIKKVTIKLYH